VGIGHPDVTESDIPTHEDTIIAYVLSDFTSEERKIIDQTIPKVSEAIHCLLTEGLTTTMNKYN
jgi:peptidyl-tRNA hydrolase